jgi:hypothetical protein
MSRRINRGLTTALICALVLAWVNPAYHDNALQDAESIGLSYYFAGVAALVANSWRFRRHLDVLGGFFLAATALSKEPFSGAVLGTWVTAYFLRNGTTDFKQNALRYIKFTIAGVLTMVGALCAYMVPTGSMKRYLELFVEYAALFRNPSTSYCVILGRWKPSTPLGELQAQVTYINKQFFNMATIGYLTPFFLASFLFAWRRSRALFFASFATFLLAMYAVTATNCQWPHYYNMALSGMFFFFVVGIDGLNPRLAGWGWALRALVVAVFLGSVGYAAYPRVTAELAGWPHRFVAVPEPVPGVYEFIAQNSDPEDKILTTGPPQLYMYANRQSALRESSILDEFIIYYPGNTDEERVAHLRAQLIKNMPKIVIMDPENQWRKQRHMNALLTPFLKEFGYKQVGPYYYLRPN